MGEAFGAQREIEPGLVGMPDDASESLGKACCVAMIAPGCNLRAARERIPRRVTPFNRAAVSHAQTASGGASERLFDHWGHSFSIRQAKREPGLIHPHALVLRSQPRASWNDSEPKIIQFDVPAAATIRHCLPRLFLDGRFAGSRSSARHPRARCCAASRHAQHHAEGTPIEVR
jgi:hypothetical protein